LGEKLDSHRKARQALHPGLTMTGMYNALEALRQGRELTSKEKIVHEQGLVTVLRQLHDALDAAVAEAYGWPAGCSADLPDEEILSRLAVLNAERAAEEKQGNIRWIRPEYQTRSKEEREAIQGKLAMAVQPVSPAPAQGKAAKVRAATRTAWPADLLEQTQAVREAVKTLQEAGVAVTPDSVAARFARAPRARVREILHILESVGFMDRGQPSLRLL
jgi:hypothetical protein